MTKELLVVCKDCPGAHPANAGACPPPDSPCFSATAFSNGHQFTEDDRLLVRVTLEAENYKNGKVLFTQEG